MRLRWAGETGIQTIKFSGLGAVNFVLTFSVFAILLEGFAVNYNVALFLAWLAGMFFMYVTNFVWVFQQGQALRFDARFVKFLATGTVSIICNMLALDFLVRHFGSPPFLTQLALVPPVVLFNFLTAKYFSLRQTNAA
jgi:putative flippase GtrA